MRSSVGAAAQTPPDAPFAPLLKMPDDLPTTYKVSKYGVKACDNKFMLSLACIVKDSDLAGRLIQAAKGSGRTLLGLLLAEGSRGRQGQAPRPHAGHHQLRGLQTSWPRR